MAHAHDLSVLKTQYGDRCVFLSVYIAEAHAADEWPVGARISFCNQPRHIGERVALAASFVQKYAFTLPMVVDDPARDLVPGAATDGAIKPGFDKLWAGTS